MKNYQRTLRVLRNDRDMSFYQLAQPVLGCAGTRDCGIPQGEKLINTRFDDLQQQCLFAVYVCVEASGKHTDGTGNVAHGGAGVTLGPKEASRLFENRPASFPDTRASGHR
jgi:hypothetical protein